MRASRSPPPRQARRTYGRAPEDDHLLPIYEPDAWRQRVAVAEWRGHEQVDPVNPCWERWGPFEAPDGYRVVIGRRGWN